MNKRSRHLAIAFALIMSALITSGCATKRELATPQGEGSDEMRRSPCVCVELDYDGKGYRWLG